MLRSFPLILGGEISEIYTLLETDARPIPNPIRTLPSSAMKKKGGQTVISEPRIYRTSEDLIEKVRPYKSGRKPPRPAPITAEIFVITLTASTDLKFFSKCISTAGKRPVPKNKRELVLPNYRIAIP